MATRDLTTTPSGAVGTPGAPLRSGTFVQPAVSSWTKFRQRYFAQYIAIAPFYILFLIFGLFLIAFAGYLAFQKQSAK